MHLHKTLVNACHNISEGNSATDVSLRAPRVSFVSLGSV